MSKGFEHWNEAFDEDKFDELPKTVSFEEEVFELAFGDDAIHKGYSYAEVLAKLREFSDNALKYEEQDIYYTD